MYKHRRTRWSTQVDDRDRDERRNRPRNKWGFAFCFLFTNQAGTVIYSFAGFTLMITTMLFQWYAPSLTSSGVRALQNVLLHTYLFVMLAGFIIAFVAAYIEKGVLAKVAALLVLIGTILYIIFFFMSFLTETMMMLYICPEMRCPDHHWLQDSMWRGYVVYSENVERYRNLEKEIKEIEDKINSAVYGHLASNEFNNSHRSGFLQNLISKIYPNKNISLKLESDNVTVRRYETVKPPAIIRALGNNKGHYVRLIAADNEGDGLLIFTSVFFGIFIIVFFVYAIVTFFAYGKSLSQEK